MTELLGLNPTNDWASFSQLAARLALDLFFATLVIRGVYARAHHNREYIFTYYLFNVITFCLCLLLRRVPSDLGFALALFGVFGMLRYRTEQIRIRELTYMFVVIGLGILHAIANEMVSLAEMLSERKSAV